MIVRNDLLQGMANMQQDFETRSSNRSGYGNAYIGSSAVDAVENYANGTKILTGDGKNSVISVAAGVVVDAGDDEDNIIIVGMGNEVYAKGGDDQIYSQYNNNHIDKGTGSDKVHITAQDASTITGLDKAADDVADTIITAGLSFQYVKNQEFFVAWYALFW